MLLKLLLLVGCLTVIQGAIVPKVENIKVDPAVLIKTGTKVDAEKFLAEHPNAVKLQPQVKTKRNVLGPYYEIYELNFTLGTRLPGDDVAYRNVCEMMWYGEPSNPQLRVRYPAIGEGQVVTYIDILITQSEPYGFAYVSDGGIGQRHIEFFVFGFDTYFWIWDVKVYAK